MIKHLFVGAALLVALLGSALAGASVPPPASATTNHKCKAPKVPTQVKNKAGKIAWICRNPTGVTPDTVIDGKSDRR